MDRPKLREKIKAILRSNSGRVGDYWNVLSPEKFDRVADQILALIVPKDKPPLLNDEELGRMRQAKSDAVGYSLELQPGEVAQAQREADIIWYKGGEQ